ncbi:hypothetical protein PHYPO_G00206810 [Pangasianodon hypophthalmus]|uniref:Uncharacterized protein n=1 Tax=Pangasianodon hypophthalmus TaxID=310915 RepID=A0A5N5PE73_PANHP|nr:hypothetical protein PHYPO_G00206810 [Pangasianodon hypophthalmus]
MKSFNSHCYAGDTQILHELVVDELNELTLWPSPFLWREVVTPSREGKSAELLKARSESELWISAELLSYYTHATVI